MSAATLETTPTDHPHYDVSASDYAALQTALADVRLCTQRDASIPVPREYTALVDTLSLVLGRAHIDTPPQP